MYIHIRIESFTFYLRRKNWNSFLLYLHLHSILTLTFFKDLFHSKISFSYVYVPWSVQPSLQWLLSLQSFSLAWCFLFPLLRIVVCAKIWDSDVSWGRHKFKGQSQSHLMQYIWLNLTMFSLTLLTLAILMHTAPLLISHGAAVLVGGTRSLHVINFSMREKEKMHIQTLFRLYFFNFFSVQKPY